MLIAKSVRGMNDLFETDLVIWRQIEKSLARVFHAFGYGEIRTPILEELALFKRGVGENTDIVEKEMFILKDKDHEYCLRPENTASVVRALIERGGISEDTQEKLYYLGPMFRKERPQRGRLRQFHQFGVELFGVSEPSADIEVIAMVAQLISELSLPNITLKLNSLGSSSERVIYRESLKEFLLDNQEELCEDCNRRIELNPLRALDCKNKSCSTITKEAPKSCDFLSQSSKEHYELVKKGLKQLNIDYVLEPRLVRGLDYYNKTVFEFVAEDGLGAQNTIIGGGRYDGLFKLLGNKVDLPAIGCAGGIERIALLMNENKNYKPNIDISFIAADDIGKNVIIDLVYGLRGKGISADFSLVNKSTKAQMRRADKLGANFVAVIGEQEIKTKSLLIKNLKDRQSKKVDLNLDQIASLL